MRREDDKRYERRPSGKEEWKNRATTILSGFAHDWHSKLAPAFGASGAAAARLERAAAGKGVVVTTGQQPGLFGGPIYALSKALSALAIANELERVTGIPVAPVFWAATDDSDFREASRITIAVYGGAQELVAEAAGPIGAPMAQTPLGDVSALLAALVHDCGSASDPKLVEALRSAYSAHQTVGRAYVTLLRSLLEPLGITVFDASHEAVRRASAPTIDLALQRAEAIARAITDNNAAIESEGHAVQVRDVAGLSVVCETTSEGRKRVPIKRAGRASSSAAELSPNVLLRPVVERQILPTLTYIGGPAEIAYFAQLSPIATTLGLARPLIVPRWSCTIVEPHIREILDRLRADLADFRDPHAIEARVARGLIPSDVLANVEKLRRAVEERTTAIGDALKNNDIGLTERVSEGLRRNLDHRVDRFERRLVAASKHRNANLMNDVATARGALFPLGKPQERALSFIPFLARYGTQLEEAMLAEATQHAKALL